MLKDTRKGAYAEYLSTYILSYLGFATPVPRQEDYGIDFFCSLNYNAGDSTIVGDSYAVQIKSSFKPVVYGKFKKGKWDQKQIKFLFELQVPFYFGIVDLNNDTLNLYTTSAFRFIKKEFPNCSTITFTFYEEPGGENIVHYIDQIKPIKKLKENQGDHNNYFINLRHPVLQINVKDLNDESTIDKYIKILRMHVRMEMRNIAYDLLKWPTFYWPHKFTTNVEDELKTIYKWIHFDDEPHISNPDLILEQNADLIIALALSYKLHNRMDEYNELCKITRRLNIIHKSEELGKKHPGLFE